MADKTKEGFEGTIARLLAASPKNSSKADPVKAWIRAAFNENASVARITEDKQLGNRITEQFAHQEPIVVFVLEPNVNCDSLSNKVSQRRYPKLEATLLMRNNAGLLTYEKLLIKSPSAFSLWAGQILGVNAEVFVGMPQAAIPEINGPRQRIIYGAPGTGKSFCTDGELLDANGNEKAICFRTTFHPDSDYSTFIGAFKPAMDDAQKIVYDFRPQAFMNAYVAAWKEAAKGAGGKTRTDNVKKPYAGLNAVMVNVVNSFIAEGGKGVEKSRKEIIAKAIELSGGEFGELSFVPSDYCYNRVNGAMTLTRPALFEFLGDGRYKCLGADDSTYTGDIFWREKRSDVDILVGKCTAGVRKLAEERPSKPVVLIVEEINRGNCAQIFGDLFQLLDRDESGYSTYPINADVDLANWLSEDEQFGAGLEGIDRPSCIRADDWGEILTGRKLALPPTLYIWATMNTSDQSLFPIDSAFKRRWDWKYVPIAKPDKDGDNDWRDRAIQADGKYYDWWKFISILNHYIRETTKSEDKQLGYFFVKAPDATGIITADQFVNKVLFYLFGDVFKDWELPTEVFEKDAGTHAKYAFKDFFYDGSEPGHKAGGVKEDEVVKFIKHLKWDGKDVTESAEAPKTNGEKASASATAAAGAAPSTSAASAGQS